MTRADHFPTEYNSALYWNRGAGTGTRGSRRIPVTLTATSAWQETLQDSVAAFRFCRPRGYREVAWERRSVPR